MRARCGLRGCHHRSGVMLAHDGVMHPRCHSAAVIVKPFRGGGKPSTFLQWAPYQHGSVIANRPHGTDSVSLVAGARSAPLAADNEGHNREVAEGPHAAGRDWSPHTFDANAPCWLASTGAVARRYAAENEGKRPIGESLPIRQVNRGADEHRADI